MVNLKISHSSYGITLVDLSSSSIACSSGYFPWPQLPLKSSRSNAHTMMPPIPLLLTKSTCIKFILWICVNKSDIQVCIFLQKVIIKNTLLNITVVEIENTMFVYKKLSELYLKFEFTFFFRLSGSSYPTHWSFLTTYGTSISGIQWRVPPVFSISQI